MSRKNQILQKPEELRGKKAVVLASLRTKDGILYKDSIVKIDAVGFPDKDYRVIDENNKIWYVDDYHVKIQRDEL